MEYYIQGSRERGEEIKAVFEAKGYTLYRLVSNCNSEDLIYYSLNGIVRGIKKDNLYLFEAHPGYEELKLPTKPQFKEGDWVVKKDGKPFCSGNYAEQITSIEDDEKGKCIYLSSTSCIRDNAIRLWTIQDAKDSDVLAINWQEDDDSWEKIVIFKKYHNKGVKGLTESPCVEGYGNTFKNGKLAFPEEVPYYSETWTDNLHPATAKQRDLLFQKMKENGYEWDAEKKELREIKPHYDISNFKPFDKVLVRDDYRRKWQCAWFSDYDKELPYPFITTGSDYKQCIPFEVNKHLLGTTDMCDEMYINW